MLWINGNSPSAAKSTNSYLHLLTQQASLGLLIDRTHMSASLTGRGVILGYCIHINKYVNVNHSQGKGYLRVLLVLFMNKNFLLVLKSPDTLGITTCRQSPF